MNQNKLSLGWKTACIITASAIWHFMGCMSAHASSSSVYYLAQNPNLITPLPENSQPKPKPIFPSNDVLDVPASAPSEADPESAIEFQVKQFKLIDNTVLEESAVEAVLARYRDRPLKFGDLLELESALTKLYTDNGYINSGVVVPAQDVNRGVVTLQAVEGSLESIEIAVDGRLKESYIRSRLARGAKSPLNIKDLQSALQLLQLNPLVEDLNAELSVGQSRDRWKLDVDINQGDAFDPVLFVNNNRTPSVGSFQRGLELNHNNVLGYSDRLGFRFSNTNGSNDIDTSYRVPVNAKEGTIALGYRFVDSDIVESDFEQFNIESQTDKLELSFRQPLILRADADSIRELAIGLGFDRQTNEVTIDDLPFPELSPGADENGETKISVIRFFQDWTKRTAKDVLLARSQFSLGADIFGATVNQGLPDSQFIAWRGQVQWLRQLNIKSLEGANLLLRSDIQLTGDDLVPLERFSLGGVSSVRGYRQDALLGDSGIFASAELEIPFYRWSDRQNQLSAVSFIDLGTTWSNSDNLEDEDTLAAIGVGLELDMGDTLSANLDYGIPLVGLADSNNSLQEKGLYFSLRYFPF